MEKKYDIVALGELLIDMTPYGTSNQGHMVYEANPGGAPCNVLAMAANLGSKCSFIGKVGYDHFGNYLKDVLIKHNIDTSGLIFDSQHSTTMAFVHLSEQGERFFSFYRKSCADNMLSSQDLNIELIKNCKILHFGSLSLTNEPARMATKKAIETAHLNESIISFDPNIRLSLWENQDILKNQVHYGLSNCDVLKVSEEEAFLLSGGTNILSAADYIQNRYPNIRMAFYTLGQKGCYFRCGKLEGMEKPPKTNVVDTTGAGDSFFGCILHEVAKRGTYDWDSKTLSYAVQMANTAASIVVTRRGAIEAMPTIAQIKEEWPEYTSTF